MNMKWETGPLVMDRTGMQKGSLDGEVAVVTGGAGNVGLGVARSLAWLGAKVVIADVTEEEGRKAQALIDSENRPGTALFVQTDVSDETSMKQLSERSFQNFGKVDILVNNAMIMSMGAPILKTTVYQMDRQYEIAGRGTLLGIQNFLPGMQERRHGVIMYMATAFKHPVGPSNYCAAKAAGASIMMSLASELGTVEESGISVFTFIPAGVGFPHSAGPLPKDLPKSFKMPAMPGYEANIPPEDSGAAVAHCIVHAKELHGSGIMIGHAFRDMEWQYPRPETVPQSDFQRIDDLVLALMFGYMGPGFPDPKVPLRGIARE